jgi:hypothetical protein
VCSSIFEVVTAFDSPSINASMTSCTSLHLNSGPVPDFEFPRNLNACEQASFHFVLRILGIVRHIQMKRHTLARSEQVCPRGF